MRGQIAMKKPRQLPPKPKVTHRTTRELRGQECRAQSADESAGDKGQQVFVELLLVGSGQPVRRAGIDLERCVRHDLR